VCACVCLRGLRLRARVQRSREAAHFLFVFHGIVITAIGIFDSEEAEDKAAGIDINLWSGPVMLVFGLGMLVWMWSSTTTTARSEPADEKGH